jgi:hypothetical protein
MPPLAIALIVFACVFGGALLGVWLGSRLPGHHVDQRTKDLVKLGMGTVATLMALVLGLLVSTAKASFDSTTTDTKQFAAKLVQLDVTLKRYGPETTTARHLLQQFLALKIAELWPPSDRRHGYVRQTDESALLDAAADQILSLSPRDEVQERLRSRALQLAADLGQARSLILMHTEGQSIPTIFLVVLVFWATILFVSFGLFAPRHATAITVLLVCALSIAAAIFVILEMDRPFTGFINIPSGPARRALEQMR